MLTVPWLQETTMAYEDSGSDEDEGEWQEPEFVGFLESQDVPMLMTRLACVLLSVLCRWE